MKSERKDEVMELTMMEDSSISEECLTRIKGGKVFESVRRRREWKGGKKIILPRANCEWIEGHTRHAAAVITIHVTKSPFPFSFFPVDMS